MDEARTPATLIVVPTDAFAETAARWIAERITRAVRRRGVATVALAGGGTPRPVYERLAGMEVPWSAVHLFFGDERRVPPDDPASNYRMVRESLLDAIGGAVHVHRMRGEDADGAAAADAYEAGLPPSLDVVVLGMGDDAHTASLFPGSAALTEQERRVVAVAGPAGGPPRLTLTPVAIGSARDRVVLVAGASKAAVLAEVLGSSPDPLRRPVQTALNGTWIVDAAAAGRLGGSG